MQYCILHAQTHKSCVTMESNKASNFKIFNEVSRTQYCEENIVCVLRHTDTLFREQWLYTGWSYEL